MCAARWRAVITSTFSNKNSKCWRCTATAAKIPDVQFVWTWLFCGHSRCTKYRLQQRHWLYLVVFMYLLLALSKQKTSHSTHWHWRPSTIPSISWPPSPTKLDSTGIWTTFTQLGHAPLLAYLFKMLPDYPHGGCFSDTDRNLSCGSSCASF